jgi:hypothetical protein
MTRPGESVEGITVPLGNPDALYSAGSQLTGVSSQLQESASQVAGMPSLMGSWAGPGSSSFASLTGDEALSLQAASRSVLMAGISIRISAEELEHAQQRAQKAIARARRAREEINDAKEAIREAVDAQHDARGRMQLAAAAREAAEFQMLASAVDALVGNGTAAAAAQAADDAYRAAERDLLEAERREARARDRLQQAEEDLKEARKDGHEAADDAELVALGMQGTLAMIPSGVLGMPGVPAREHIGDAAGIPRPQPQEIPISEREPPENWPGIAKSLFYLGRGEATAIAGAAGLAEDAYHNPEKIPGAVADVGSRAVHDPIGTGKAFVGYDVLASGRIEDWFGQMGAGAFTGGTATYASRAARLRRVAPEPDAPPPVVPARPWRRGDDIWAPTAAGTEPTWTTVRGRYWKNVAEDPAAAAQWDAANLARMRDGVAPQRFNPDKGGMESMELSHEPVPARDGGRNLVPRWPQDHAAVDPFRHPGY